MFTSIKTTILNYIKPTLIQFIDADSLNVDTLSISLDGVILINNVVCIKFLYCTQFTEIRENHSKNKFLISTKKIRIKKEYHY